MSTVATDTKWRGQSSLQTTPARPSPPVPVQETACKNHPAEPSQLTELCEIVVNLCFQSLNLGAVSSPAIDNQEHPPYKVSVIEEIRTQGLSSCNLDIFCFGASKC